MRAGEKDFGGGKRKAKAEEGVSQNTVSAGWNANTGM